MPVRAGQAMTRIPQAPAPPPTRSECGEDIGIGAAGEICGTRFSGLVRGVRHGCRRGRVQEPHRRRWGRKKPVGFDVQFSIAPETAGEMMVPVSPEPVVLPFGDGADRGFERVHIVVFAFETLDVAQEGGPVDDLAHHR